jgi:hypothetical protein
MSMNTPTVFISYSHKDEEWKDRLLTHLDSLQMEDVRAWSDRQIGAGNDWYQEIRQAMDAASVAILMVSASFLSSEFIMKEEVPHLLKRQDEENLRIFPIIVTPCAEDRALRKSYRFPHQKTANSR